MKALEYEQKENDIVIITWKYNIYELNVFEDKDTAENDILNCFKCNYVILHCSDENLTKKYLEPKT